MRFVGKNNSRSRENRPRRFESGYVDRRSFMLADQYLHSLVAIDQPIKKSDGSYTLRIWLFSKPHRSEEVFYRAVRRKTRLDLSL